MLAGGSGELCDFSLFLFSFLACRLARAAHLSSVVSIPSWHRSLCVQPRLTHSEAIPTGGRSRSQCQPPEVEGQGRQVEVSGEQELAEQGLRHDVSLSVVRWLVSTRSVVPCTGGHAESATIGGGWWLMRIVVVL